MQNKFYSFLCQVVKLRFVVMLGILSTLSGSALRAQYPAVEEDGKRYLSLMLLNLSQEKDFELEVIRQAAAAGVNSVELTIAWDKVYRDSPTGPDGWERFDKQIELCTQLGLKVAIRVQVGRNAFFIKGFWDEANGTRDYKQNPLRGIYDYTHFSLLHQPSVEKAADFVQQVAKRYKYLLDQKNLLFISTVISPTQEAEYYSQTVPPGAEYTAQYSTIFDYSDSYKKGFIEWLRSKYKKIIRLNLLWGSSYKTFDEIAPPVNIYVPSESFFGRRGKDWYIFRHLALKQFNDRMIAAVKEVDTRIPYVPEFGSVFDNQSVVRGTLAFPDLTEKADGIKVHDSPNFDHRWTMDLLRSNRKPGQWIMNEVFYAQSSPNTDYYRLINESFESGAKIVVFVLSTPGHVAAVRGVVADMAQRWLDQPLVTPVATDTVSYRLSRAVDRGVQSTGVFDAWKTKARGTGTPKPVSVIINQDLLSDEYWKAAANTPPYLLNPVPMQIIAVSKDFNFQLPVDTFSDYDGTIVKTEVFDLPPWLTYQAGHLRGTPTTLGDTRLRVRGTDDEGGFTDAYFTIRVDTRENANKPPTVKQTLSTVTTALGEQFSFVLPPDLFADIDGKITKVEVGTLPAWLSYRDGRFIGTPTAVGEYRVALKAYDDLDAFVETFFIIKAVEPQFLNNPPYVARALPVRFAMVNEPFQYTLPGNIFADNDGFISLISVQNAPTWLKFSLNEFSGTPTEVGKYRVMVRAYDNAGGFVETPLLIQVEVPRLTFDLLQSGRAIERQRLLTLTDGQVLYGGSLPKLLNIYAYGNFDYDRVDFDLRGPYSRRSRSDKFPFALFPEDGGFAPYVGGYTLNAYAYRKDSLVLKSVFRFSIAPGDSAQPAPLDEWVGYPNPSEGVFNIKLPASGGTYAYTITDMTGKRWSIPAGMISFHKGIAQIDLSGLVAAPGLYLLRVHLDGEEVRTFKVIKK